ncbi:MAG: hypothetical protein NVS3B26_02200 [Mycobacteriales bacterium]
MDAVELFAAEVYDEAAITAVIRPAAVLPESAARMVLVELAHRDVRASGCWDSTPVLWQRYDRAWNGPGTTPGDAMLMGSLYVTYGTPTRYAITVFRVTITPAGADAGWSVEALCDEALAFGGYTLDSCPRAELAAPPKPFRLLA